MTAFTLPANEKERLNELFHYQILDSSLEEEFDDIARIVAKTFAMPLSAISFIDSHRQWVKAQVGLGACEFKREESVCHYTLSQNSVLVVEDLSADERFNEFPGIGSPPFYHFYAGVPLVTRRGYHIGTLCMLDYKERTLTEEDCQVLASFGRNIIAQLELRLQNIELQNRNAMQTSLSSALSHDIKNPLYNVKMMLDMQEETEGNNASPEEKVVNKLLRQGVENTIDMVNNMIEWGKLQLNGDGQCSVFNLRQIADEALNEVYTSNAAKYNTLVNAVPENLIVKGDPSGIRFVLRNLLTNACKFTHNGSVTVNCDVIDGKRMLQVKDTGMGMSPETTARLNRKEKITHTTGTHDETGHGLGLGLVQEYLARQNKELFYQSIMGMGTVVSFVV